jgi:hypothetical protein
MDIQDGIYSKSPKQKQVVTIVANVQGSFINFSFMSLILPWKEYLVAFQELIDLHIIFGLVGWGYYGQSR